MAVNRLTLSVKNVAQVKVVPAFGILTS